MLQIKTIIAAALMLCLSLPCSAVAAGPHKGGKLGQPVTMVTADGMILHGLFVPPAGRSEKTFILLHGLGSNQEEWQGFANKLTKDGYGFLSYDARGHGESTRSKTGETISYQQFGNPGPGTGWDNMLSDLGVAVKYLINVRGIPENKIGVMGASLGANIALVYASQNTAVSPIVLLSAGMNYAGVHTDGAIRTMNKRPILIAAAPGDTYAFQSAQLLYQTVQHNKKAELIIGDGSFHGVQMFNGAFDTKVLRWLRK